MKRKIVNYVIFLITSITSVFAIGDEKVTKVTDFEIGTTLPMVPYGEVGGVNMVDTGVTIENGDIWIWGFRGSAQAGNGKNVVNGTSDPQRVDYFVKNSININQSAGGIYHILVLDDKGDVWGWGQNLHHESGAGICHQTYINTPCRILRNQNIIQIGAGEYISLALSKSGEVYTWGHGAYGQAANGLKRANNPLYKIPQEYFNNQPVVLIGAAYEGGYAVNASGQVFGWGDDQHNSFGYENSNEHEYRARPVPLNIQVDGKKIDYICGGEGYTEYLLDNGDVYGMGVNLRLGIGKRNGKTSEPVKIMSNVRTLYCRFDGSLAITFDNDIYTWGVPRPIFNIYGLSPIKRDHAREITKVDGGKEHIYYWTSEGKAYGIGYGNYFKLDQRSGTNVNAWPGKSLDFLIKVMKKTYGDDYIPGQGQ